MDKLKQAKEIYGFTNVWTNDGKILFKSESNAKPQVYQLIFLLFSFGKALDGKVSVMSLLEVCFLCWGVYESIQFLVSTFSSFCSFLLIFNIKKLLISLYITCSSKKTFTTLICFDKSKSFIINNILIVLLVINHIERLPLNNHLLPPIRAAEIVECVRKYMDGSSVNLQSLSSY